MNKEVQPGDGAPKVLPLNNAADGIAIEMGAEPWTVDEFGELAVEQLQSANDAVHAAEMAIEASEGDPTKYRPPFQVGPGEHSLLSHAASAIVLNAQLARLVPALEQIGAAMDRTSRSQLRATAQSAPRSTRLIIEAVLDRVRTRFETLGGVALPPVLGQAFAELRIELLSDAPSEQDEAFS